MKSLVLHFYLVTLFLSVMSLPALIVYITEQWILLNIPPISHYIVTSSCFNKGLDNKFTTILVFVFVRIYIFLYTHIHAHTRTHAHIFVHVFIIYLIFYFWLYIYIYITIFTNPSTRAGYDIRSILKLSLKGVNPEFLFS